MPTADDVDTVAFGTRRMRRARPTNDGGTVETPSAHRAMPPPVPASAGAIAAGLVNASRRSLREEVIRHLQVVPTLPLPGGGATLARWRALAGMAAQDVCLAKVLEAHHDALAILSEIGPGDDQAPEGLLAVWAAEPPDARLIYTPTSGQGGTLSGTKAWCSGADLVDEALVTAHSDQGRVLVCVALSQTGVSGVDDSWKAVGMARVNSGRVSFSGARATPVGPPEAYLDRPGFWHGGAGIAACWYGAATAIAETLRTDPRVQKDAFAQVHLGAIDIALQSCRAMLRQLAATIDAEPAQPHVLGVIRARSLVERSCTRVIDRVGRALGPAPLCADADHAQRCADLAVFIRQSHGERDWAAIGKGVSAEPDPWQL